MFASRMIASLSGILLSVLIIAHPAMAEVKLLPEPELNDEGVHTQSWFLDSFLDLREDIADSAKEGKNLAIFWEQRGCPYCGEMHKVNLRVPETVEYIKANFNVIQLNLWGDREVTDIDGEVLSEKKLARKYRVQFTPTINFFPKDLEKGTVKSGLDVEVFRMPGYFKPFHFHSSFVFVKEQAYKTEPNFQRWLQAYAEELREKGKEVKIW